MYPTAAGEESSLYSMSTGRITCSPTARCNLGCTIYGIPDIDLLPHHNLGVQMIEEEFNTYSISHISPQGTDPLANQFAAYFYRKSGDINGMYRWSLDGCHAQVRPFNVSLAGRRQCDVDQ
jgi:hypothetical protein